MLSSRPNCCWHQANVITHMGDVSGRMALSQLVSRCGDFDEDDALGALAFWVQKGVVRECAEESPGGEEDRYFEVVEIQEALAAMDSSSCADDDVGAAMVRISLCRFFVCIISFSLRMYA